MWCTGSVPVAVVMITFNEGHNLRGVLENIKGWASEVFIVDSYSSDETVDIALQYGVHIVQRVFRGFGDQWNFALSDLPISTPWTMKLDPDERLDDELKREIATAIARGAVDALSVRRRLWFMGGRLPVGMTLTRVWRTGGCRFSDVLVNEHPLVEGITEKVNGELLHLDSPDLHHWIDKQNRHTTAEAIAAYRGHSLSVQPKLYGSRLERRMWIKKHFWLFPARYWFLFLYHLLVLGAWRSGRVGWKWSRLRTEVYRLQEYKRFEMERLGREPMMADARQRMPDPRVPHC